MRRESLIVIIAYRDGVLLLSATSSSSQLSANAGRRRLDNLLHFRRIGLVPSDFNELLLSLVSA